MDSNLRWNDGLGTASEPLSIPGQAATIDIKLGHSVLDGHV